MFVGTVNAAIRKYLAERTELFRNREVVIGCSGNFSVESALYGSSRNVALHSNDVSFYSVMLGKWLAGGSDLPFELTESWNWLAPYCRGGEAKVATIVLLSGLIRWVPKTAEKTPGDHSRRMIEAYREQWPRLHAEQLEKVRQVGEHLSLRSFHAGDVREHFQHFADDPNAVFLCFAPTYKGGYENLWKPLEQIVRWTPPEYGMLGDEERSRLIEWMFSGGRRSIWMDDRDLTETMGLRPEFAVETGRMRTQYLYANCLDEPGFVGKHSTIRDPKWKVATLVDGTGAMTVERIDGDVFAFYRENYLAKSIAPAPPMWCYAVKVDGEVVGCFGMQEPRWGEKDGVYMLSDFAVSPLPHKRASKLVVMAAMTEEVRSQLERARLMPTRTVATTAFTKKPVSMKYRGLLEVVKRGDGFLNYAGRFSGMTAQQAYAEWWRRWGTDTRAD
jgi:hypothetical protein